MSPLCIIELIHLEGAIDRVADADTAFPSRDSPFFCMLQSTWTHPDQAEPHQRWTANGWDAVAPFSDGRTYPSFLDSDEPPHRVADSYGEQKMARLTALKRTFDPTNMFRLNKNIQP